MRRALEVHVVQHTPEANLLEYDEFSAYDETPMKTLTKHQSSISLPLQDSEPLLPLQDAEPQSC